MFSTPVEVARVIRDMLNSLQDAFLAKQLLVFY